MRMRRCAVGDLTNLRSCLPNNLDDRFHETSIMEPMVWWRIPCLAVGETKSGIMAGWRRAVESTMMNEEIERLTAPSRSRTEPAGPVSRAQMLLAYRENPSFCAVGQSVGVHHQMVQRRVERALGYGPLAGHRGSTTAGQRTGLTPEAKAWLVSLACDKAKSMAIRTSCGPRGC